MVTLSWIIPGSCTGDRINARLHLDLTMVSVPYGDFTTAGCPYTVNIVFWSCSIQEAIDPAEHATDTMTVLEMIPETGDNF